MGIIEDILEKVHLKKKQDSPYAQHYEGEEASFESDSNVGEDGLPRNATGEDKLESNSEGEFEDHKDEQEAEDETEEVD